MRKIIYAIPMSLDGYIEDRGGRFDWAEPDAELHQHFNDHYDHIDTDLYGRRMWEMMSAYWPTADQDPDAPPLVVDFSRRWQQARHIVFSRHLTSVGHGATLAEGDIAEVVRRLKAEPGKDMSVSGAGLAASFMALDLIDEYWLYVVPVAVGGGKPFFQDLHRQLRLRLLSTRTFSGGVVHLRYAPMREGDAGG
ncbi:MAG TPA: dihydrofolate reductase family protein [Devosiaceae bacterium]|jgi:dihydrofolate reductase